MTGATGKRAADAEPAQPKAAAAKRAKGKTAEEAPENEDRPPKPKPVVPEVIEPTAAAEVDVDIGHAPEWPEVLTVLTSKNKNMRSFEPASPMPFAARSAPGTSRHTP